MRPDVVTTLCMADGNWIERIVDTLRVVREVQP